MPDILDLLGKWWKQILTIVVLAVIASAVACFIQPKQYLSTTTAIPASSVGTDRTRVFGDNLQGLYSALGSPDDLDRVIGTAQLDTVYRLVADKFQLPKHYNISAGKSPARTVAANKLMKHSKVMKSAYGELKVKVWDKDPVMAARLANGITQTLQDIHQALQSAGNQTTLKGLIDARHKMDTRLDSMGMASSANPSVQYEKLINQYQLLVDSKPPALIIVEEASAADEPDKPKMMRTIVVTTFLSFLFALLLTLVLERRSKTRTA